MPAQQRPKHFRPVLDALEERTMLTASLSLVGTQTLVNRPFPLESRFQAEKPG